MGCRRFAPWGDESSDDNDDDSRVSRHPHLRSYRAWWSYHPSVPTDQKVDWQQGGSRQINTTGHSTPLAITSVQLNGTGRPVLVHRISVRDEEVVGSNPATPTQKHFLVEQTQGRTFHQENARVCVWSRVPRLGQNADLR